MHIAAFFTALDAAICANSHHQMSVTSLETTLRSKQNGNLSCEVFILFLSQCLFLLMHGKPLYDSLEIIVTDHRPGHCGGAVCDDYSVKSAVTAADRNHNNTELAGTKAWEHGDFSSLPGSRSQICPDWKPERFLSVILIINNCLNSCFHGLDFANVNHTKVVKQSCLLTFISNL